MISRWVGPGGQSTSNGLVCAAACGGIASTYLLFGRLMDRFDWPGAFLVAAAATALLTLLWALLASDHPAGAAPAGAARPGEPAPAPVPSSGAIQGVPPAPGEPFAFRPRPRGPFVRGAFLGLLRQRSLLLLTVSYAALGYFQYLFFYWIQYYFEEVVRLDKGTSRLYATIPTLAMGAGMLAGGWLADGAVALLGERRGRALVPAAGLLVSAVVLAGGLLSGEPTVLLVCFSVSMACAGASEGPFWTTAVALGGRLGGTSAAILNTGGNAGGLLAPVVTPLFSHFLGWQAGIGVACVPCVVGAALWWWIDPTEAGPPAAAGKRIEGDDDQD
jgi:MFS family permease